MGRNSGHKGDCLRDRERARSHNLFEQFREHNEIRLRPHYEFDEQEVSRREGAAQGVTGKVVVPSPVGSREREVFSRGTCTIPLR